MRHIRDNLLFQFSIVGFLALVIAGAAVAMVLSHIIQEDAIEALIEEAVDASSVRLLRAISPADLESPMLGARYTSFHDFVQQQIVSKRTARIKIWARDGTIIYDADPAKIGLKFPDEQGLQAALRGDNFTELSIPTDAEHTDEDDLEALMEVYTPLVFPGMAEPQGAFEFYQYYAPTARLIGELRAWVIGLISLGFMGVYVSLISIMWKGWRTINTQRGQLESFNDELKEQVRQRTLALHALHASEKRYRELYDEAPIAYYGVGIDGRICRANEHTAHLSGYAVEELVGRPVFDLYADTPAGKEKAQAMFQRSRAGEEIRGEELEWRTADGRSMWISLTVRPVRDAEGRVVESRAMAEDITGRKRAEQVLARTAQELARSNTELEQFAYIASHDLQEPLRKVQAFGDRLQAKYAEALGDQGRDYLERMQGAAGRMQTLINDLLTYSRVTTKAQPFASVDLNSTVHSVLSDLETRIEQVRGRVEVGDLPTLEADPVQMRQLLQNIIGNALKFHRPDAPPLVKVHGHYRNGQDGHRAKQATDQHWYQLHIEDNGIGFDEKHLNRIFQVFQRLHSRSEYEGTGIGLATCRKIVERHGGSITARSTPGHGTTFIVTLPIAHAFTGETI